MVLDHLVREPEHIVPSTPILFLLHGYGSNEHDLFSFIPDLPSDWIIVSFRAPLPGPMEGYGWYDIDFMDLERLIDVPQATDSLNALLNSISGIRKRYELSEKSLSHLCGFSQGGILSYALALSHPELFSKVACLSAYPEYRLLTQRVKDKKRLESLRFFISHGTDDVTIPLEWGAKAPELLYETGCYFTFREYESGHGVNQKNYMDLMDFFKS